MPMLSIGIDVSKGKSTVCGMKPGGEIVYAPFEVQQTREGMLELVSLLHSSGEEVRAVLESTGSYHCPVVAALLENGIFVSVVNSLRMKRFCSQSIRKVKTDRNSYPRNGRNALSEGLLQMGGKKGIPQLRTYGSTHLCHSSKRYPCASQCTIHADRHYGSDTSPPHSGGVP